MLNCACGKRLRKGQRFCSDKCYLYYEHALVGVKRRGYGDLEFYVDKDVAQALRRAESDTLCSALNALIWKLPVTISVRDADKLASIMAARFAGKDIKIQWDARSEKFRAGLKGSGRG